MLYLLTGPVLDVFQSLVDSAYMPHGQCYLWQPGLVWLQAGSDVLIGIAYSIICVLLIWFVRNREDLPFKWMFALGSMLFGMCAMTHFFGVYTIWHGIYWIDGFFNFATGVGSIVTALLLIPLIPLALELPTPTELQKANEKLKEEIAHRKTAEAELEEAYEQLKETEQLKTEFFGNVSHELRTPLTLILSPLETVLEEGGQVGREETTTESETDALAAPVRSRLETAHNNAVRMLQMVNGLLDFSHLELGEVEVDRECTDVASLTTSVAADFEPLIEKSELDLTLEADIPEPLVDIDRYLYERILFNLLSNAVKFTPEGGSVDVSLNQEEDGLALTVADTGIGIAEEDLEHIFEDFRQVEASATRRFEGTGLGLPMVKEFAELLGGTVTVRSAPGEGSAFTVRINAPPTDEPAAVSRSTEVRSAETSEVGKERRATGVPHVPTESPRTEAAENADLAPIVLAEDNDELARYIADLLAETCRVHRASNGAEAFDLIRRYDPELVVADIMMPVKDGLTLCRELKGDAATADLPVVLLTALTDREALLEGWRAGADEYLFKPFHPREVVTRVQTLLANVKRRKEAEAERRRLEEELLTISEEERRRIGRELHDSLASHLSGTAMLAGGLMEDAEANRPCDVELTEELIALIQEATEKTRALAHGLNPVRRESEGLAASLQHLTEQESDVSDLRCRYEQSGPDPDLAAETAKHLWGIANEAFTNALLHAEASEIVVELAVEDERLTLTITDDGTGLDAGESFEGEDGMGIRLMHYRADQIGGQLTFNSGEKGGAVVRCVLPFT